MEPLARHTSIVSRKGSGIYYARVRVPDDLRAAIGKTEIVKSLGTTNWREAQEKGIAELARIRSDFANRRKLAHLRASAKDGLAKRRNEIVQKHEDALAHRAKNSAAIGSMTSLYAVIRRWLEDQDRKLEVLAATIQPQEVDGYQDVLAEDIANCPNDEAAMYSQVNAVLDEYGLNVQAGTPLADKLSAFVREGTVLLFQRQAARIARRSPLPRLLPDELETSSPIALTAVIDEQRSARGITVSELIEKYEADPRRARNSPKTAMDYALIFRAMREGLGEKKQVRDVTRNHCEAIADLLWRLPRHATKRYPTLTLQEAAALADKKAHTDDPVERLSAPTINSRLGSMIALFTWAVKRNYMDSNPAKDIRVPEHADRVGPGRVPFEIDELNRIFSAPLYVGCVDDEANYARPGPNRPRRGRFWVPLISLFMGLRLNEVCQLDTEDVGEIGGVLAISMTASADGRKRLKNKSSKRAVPVHPMLKVLGFETFVRDRKATGELRLFPELPLGRAGFYSDPTSKWFSRFLDSVGVTRPGTTFHSFRHCWRDALRAADLSDERVCALGGWERGRQVHLGYGRGFAMKDLANDIAKVQYQGLDLSQLHGSGTLQPGATRDLQV